jgi:hypothetical protein
VLGGLGGICRRSRRIVVLGGLGRGSVRRSRRSRRIVRNASGVLGRGVGRLRSVRRWGRLVSVWLVGGNSANKGSD